MPTRHKSQAFNLIQVRDISLACNSLVTVDPYKGVYDKLEQEDMEKKNIPTDGALVSDEIVG